MSGLCFFAIAYYFTGIQNEIYGISYEYCVLSSLYIKIFFQINFLFIFVRSLELTVNQHMTQQFEERNTSMKEKRQRIFHTTKYIINHKVHLITTIQSMAIQQPLKKIHIHIHKPYSMTRIISQKAKHTKLSIKLT